jgi:hypothetical protein
MMLTLDVRACAAKEAAHEELELEQQVPLTSSFAIIILKLPAQCDLCGQNSQRFHFQHYRVPDH